MNRLSVWLATAALCSCVAAQAQTITVAPSAIQRCLTRGSVLLGLPSYPEDAFRLKTEARVRVELKFTAPDLAPEVTSVAVSAREYATEFKQAVLDYVGDYRVPCLTPDQPAILAQEFVFSPRDGRPVTVFAARDEQALRSGRLLACVKHESPGSTPAYPVQALNMGVEGTVVLRLSFSDAANGPAITALDQGGAHILANSVREHARGFRMPCHDGAGQVDLIQFYQFRFADTQRLVLRDMPLISLLRSIKGIRSASVYFDFNRMSCPFDVRFRLMQPHGLNGVAEVGSHDPERAPFLDWLTRQQLDLQSKDLGALLGQSALINVPCQVLNLGAQQGGGASQ